MALVFQYGSNMSLARLNSDERLKGDAKVVGVATTVKPFELVFSVRSITNDSAAADLLPNNAGRPIYGVLYEIPDCLISRDTAGSRRSLDAIEGEGTNYVRAMIDVVPNDGATVRAMTYLVKDRQAGLKTSADYVGHILVGLREHNIPAEYCQYVRSQIVKNNGDLEDFLTVLSRDE